MTTTKQYLIKKYTAFRDNIQWHIKTNKPVGGELNILEQRVKDYNEVIKDLESLKQKKNLSKSPTH